MTTLRFSAAALLLALLSVPTLAWADDWQVTKLRGNAAMLVGDAWQPLRRGDVVSDDRAIRTVGGSRMTLERGLERVALGPDTAIRIQDRSGQHFTTVKQYFGAVEVEAEARNVKHFAVVSPDLAAVVKGTRFTVTSGKSGSEVKVHRGSVEVADNDTGETVLLSVGQSASTAAGVGLAINGSGELAGTRGKSASSGKANAPGQLKKGSEGSSNAATGKGQNSGNGNSGNSNAGGSGNSGDSNAGGNSDGGSSSGGGNSNAGGNGRN